MVTFWMICRAKNCGVGLDGERGSREGKRTRETQKRRGHTARSAKRTKEPSSVNSWKRVPGVRVSLGVEVGGEKGRTDTIPDEHWGRSGCEERFRWSGLPKAAPAARPL
jgi:hypothetical protein